MPPLAGLFSSVGLLFARTEFHDVRFCSVDARAGDLSLLGRLEDEMRAALTDRVEGLGEVEWLRSADVRYRGQNWSITVDVPGAPGEVDASGLIDRFEAEHERLYGTRLEAGSPVVIRALRLTVVGPPRGGLAAAPPGGVSPDKTPRTRAADFGEAHGRLDAPVVGRASIGTEPRRGPLLVDEYDTTVVVPPDWTVACGPTGALVLEHVPVEPGAARAEATTEPETILRAIVANALATVADEMATTIFRTAHSAVVRDAMDYSAALCGPAGRRSRRQ